MARGDFSYNPNMPSYSAEYQLSNDDDNVSNYAHVMTYQQIMRLS